MILNLRLKVKYGIAQEQIELKPTLELSWYIHFLEKSIFSNQ